MSSRRIVREGYLTKSPPPDKLMAKWHERFFVLWSTQVMEYYTTKDKRAQDYCKSIDLGHCDDIIAPSRIGNRDCVIKVRMSYPRGRDYMFDCGNETNMKAWVDALNVVCKHVAMPEGHARPSNHASDRALPEVPSTKTTTKTTTKATTKATTKTADESSSSDEEGGEQVYEECVDQNFSQPHPHAINIRVYEAKTSPPEERRQYHSSRQQHDLTPPDDDPEQTYEEMNDMQLSTTPTLRPPLKLPTKSLAHTPSNGNMPPDTKKRPLAPPPKPASCEEPDQQENYEEMNDMQPSIVSKQRQPPKLPVKSLPSQTGVPQPGPDAGRKKSPLPSFKPQPAESDQQENYEVPVDTRKFPPPPLTVADHQEVEESLNMTMKKPLSNPVLKQALDAAFKKALVATPKHPLHRENSSPVCEEEEGEGEEPKQEEMYEEMDSSAPPPLSWNIAPPHTERRGSTPRHIPQSCDEPRRPQPYEDFIPVHPHEGTYEEPITTKSCDDRVVTIKPLPPGDELTSSQHRELKGVNAKDPVRSRDGTRVRGKQASNDDDDVSTEVTGVQQRAAAAALAPRRGKSAFSESSPTSPPAEVDTPPHVPRRVESIGQLIDDVPPPPPPPRKTSINPEEEVGGELSKRKVPRRDDPPAPPGRKGFVPMTPEDDPLRRGDPLAAPPGQKHSAPVMGEESPKGGGSPQSGNAGVESPGPPRWNVSKSSTQLETATNNKSRNLQHVPTKTDSTAPSGSNWMPPKDASTQLTLESLGEPTKLKPSPVRPSVMPKPSTALPPPPTPPQKASLRPPVQPKRAGSPGASIAAKPLPQPKPRARQKSTQDEGHDKEPNSTVITS